VSPSRVRIRLIHWNEEEAAQRAAALAGAGWHVERSLPPGPALLRELRAAPPAAVVIDLGRLPSQGRDVALSIRHAATTRRVPIVFIEGDQQKTAKVRALLPDAVYTTWVGVRGAIKRAIAKPPENPMKPASVFAGYSGTPLPKKLGIKPDMTVALVGAPADFARTLGTLPHGAVPRKRTGGGAGLVIWFVRSAAELREGVRRMTELAGAAPMWIAWRKRASLPSSAPEDAPSERSVRAAGLSAGWVDYKICAIDGTWSALLFTRRSPRRRRTASVSS
jgi:CheY-like chemotaxis protein